jgi:hypothetical protein
MEEAEMEADEMQEDERGPMYSRRRVVAAGTEGGERQWDNRLLEELRRGRVNDGDDRLALAYKPYVDQGLARLNAVLQEVDNRKAHVLSSIDLGSGSPAEKQAMGHAVEAAFEAGTGDAGDDWVYLSNLSEELDRIIRHQSPKPLSEVAAQFEDDSTRRDRQRQRERLLTDISERLREHLRTPSLGDNFHVLRGPPPRFPWDY